MNALDGPASYATAVNDAGVVVGNSQISCTVYRADRWNGVVPTDLGTLRGSNSYATAINTIGLIEGQGQLAGNTSSYAALWDGNLAVDLESMLDVASVNTGWDLERANDINDFGWIVESARNTFTGESHAFLLEPIAAPILVGDFDLDGDVDGRDFLAWQSGASPNPLSEGDLADWQVKDGVPPSIANALVPEPKAFVILIGSFCILLSRPKQELRLT